MVKGQEKLFHDSGLRGFYAPWKKLQSLRLVISFPPTLTCTAPQTGPNYCFLLQVNYQVAPILEF